MSALSKLLEGKPLGKEEWLSLITDTEHAEEIREEACRKRDEIYGRKIFARGLIEFTSFCRNDCYYCGIRCSNRNAGRYRLSSGTIFETVQKGY